MKIKSISIQGFRGFNEQRTINLDDRLTLIYAPNSYGKTSISEALEWLLYGITSKVGNADSKDEFKGSYRNLHLAPNEPAIVNVAFIRNGKDLDFTGVLSGVDGIFRFVNGEEVANWPIKHDLAKSPQPFILQHALKYLLLAKPADRFQGFAQILGLEELENLQINIQKLCTKPEACLPDTASRLLNKIASIENRLAIQPSLKKISTIYMKGAKSLKKAYDAIEKECSRRVPPGTAKDSVLPQLLQLREDAIGKIFKGSVELHGYTDHEKDVINNDEKHIINFIDEKFIKKYTDLIALSAAREILSRIKFYNFGITILDQDPGICPFCEQQINIALDKHIRDRHDSFQKEQTGKERLERQRKEITSSLSSLKSKLQTINNTHVAKSRKLLQLEPKLKDLQAILVPKYQVHFKAVENAITEIKRQKGELSGLYDWADSALDTVVNSINESKLDIELLKSLSLKLAQYVKYSNKYVNTISKHTAPIREADKVLQHELDKLAGTEDISILVDLVEHRKGIEKKFEIKSFLTSLKNLRGVFDRYVADKVLDAITNELTSDVMGWYDKIKTRGDPDVHFAGFDLERTKTGKAKARRVAIKAESYGKELVSAVSSLSESKLNALGLCVSIARNLKAKSPFSFLIIDDPIQSWDAEHEAQFIELIRMLLNHGKQILLMSHNKNWIRQVQKGCRSVNGRFYVFTGYTKEGPHIKETQWATWNERLKEVDAICKDPAASDVKLQQAEMEIRIVCSEVACEIYLKEKGIQKKPHDLNSGKVRKMLLESGIESGLVDRIYQTFQTTDDAHHAPVNYSPNRERIRQYHSYAYDLKKLLE